MCTDISNACCSCANPLWRFAGFGCKGSRYKILLQEIIVSAEKEDGAYLSMAEDIIPTIIDAQSADVDTISGATFSSTGIKNAVAQALEEAAK